MEFDTPESLKEHLNEQLKISIRSRAYVHVKVLILYWQDREAGFRLEGQQLGRTFKQLFGYAVGYYAIPSTQSYLQLLNFITQSILSVTKCAKEKAGASLLIIYYGGHGDENRASGEGKRSVWAATDAENSPLLEWFKIQENIKDADTDILLLLDCCYAAQAGRAREARPARIELLAAAAMGMKTPMPGPRSFTMALVRELHTLLCDDGHVLITDLHSRLVGRKANLWATPIYVKLAGGGQWTIRLEPLDEQYKDNSNDDSSSPFLQLLVRTKENLHKAHVDEIALWLGTDVPKTVTSLTVNDVVMTTSKLHTFVDNIRHGNEALTKDLDKPALQDIIVAWDKILQLVELYSAHRQDESIIDDEMSLIQKRATMFLQKLNERNIDFMDTAQRNILNSPGFRDHCQIQEAIQDPTAETLGMVDQLRLRRIVYSSVERANTDFQPQANRLPSSTIDMLHEYKVYGEHFSPGEMNEWTSRVQRLSELLSAQKDKTFLALKCLSWYREPLERRFVLQFEIPTSYDPRIDTYHSLQTLIAGAKGPVRPSLDDRFRIAVKIAKAVLKWHSVGWVHEGISSHNIVFFTLKTTRCIDYDNPFLQGFEYARPKFDPSWGRSISEIAFDVYRHPDRQGETRRSHLKIHDFYSLGVVLLEIGLWQKAFDIVVDRKERSASKGAFSMLPATMKEKLLQATRKRLAHYAGRSYQLAVEVCLTGEFGVELDDSNDSYLARSFQHSVIDALVDGIQIKDAHM